MRHCLATLLVLLAVPSVAGCRQDRVRVEMDASGESTTRSFASNALASDDRERLRSVYDADPERDADTGGERFTAAFNSSLPREVGNRNGLVDVSTRFGRTRFYWESFGDAADEKAAAAHASTGDATADDDRGLWASLESRMHGGELWVRLFGRWAERGITDPSKREEWAAYVDRDLVPLVNDAALLWSVQLAMVRANRVAQEVRKSDDHRPMTDDERFAQRVGMSSLLFLAERGLLTVEEAHRVYLVSVDGNPSKAERTWIVDTVLLPALVRQVQRFRPDVKKLDSASLVPMALSFWLYATTSPDRREILLASPAISEADKERIRNGDMNITLPPAFGFDPMRSAKKVETDVVLKTGIEPFASNGDWDPETKSVRFRTSVVEPSRRMSLYAPTFYAAWSEPDEPAQNEVFGEVLLTDDDLAAYAIWAEALPSADLLRWNAALDRLEAGEPDAMDALRALAANFEAKNAVPRRLAAWLAVPPLRAEEAAERRKGWLPPGQRADG
ncbi:MAG: hypothetical protein JNM94_12315 [Phycisphaerae bacterium]|nr:hypothetical protein [Phycisphaerae bacterium]